MRKIFKYIANHKHDFLRGLTYVVSVVIILLIYPHKGSFPYEFQKGKIWLHNDLISTFDFPIKKSEQELKLEKDSILKEFKPYYNYQSDVYTNQLKKLDKNILTLWSKYAVGNSAHPINLEEIKFFHKIDKEKQEKYIHFVRDLLAYVYEKGIVQPDDNLESQKKKDFSLVILKNNVGEESDFSDIFTPKSAYEYILQRIEALNTGNDNDKTIYLSGFFKELDLNEYLVPNLILNEDASNNTKNELIKKIALNKGMFLTDRKVIGKGEIINEEKFNVLSSLKYEYENRLGNSSQIVSVIIGHGLLVSSLILLLLIFIAHFRRDVYKNNVRYSFILLIVVVAVGIVGIVVRYDFQNLYILPFALLPIVIKTFYDSRIALFVNTVAILLTGFMTPNAFEFILLNYVAGSVAVISLTTVYKRRKLFETTIWVFITYSFLYTGIFLLQGNSLSDIQFEKYFLFAISSFLLLLAYPLIFIFERMFGFLSDITLLELSDSNQPLLRELNEKAPGTFQHSLQVANLAEEAAYKIGANPLMVRTGALYHDIGKMYNPKYFIENLSAEKNPHDSISFEASAKIIIDHVTRGVEIGRKYKLPEQIINFIRTHHGTTMVQFFYVSYKKQNPNVEVDKGIFTYPGPVPLSKETALVMMADSVEAASRSIKEFNRDVINDLVDNIIYYQMINNQYNECDITYREITKVKEVFKRKLMNIYHLRVEYPEMD
jgi:cyclic-di-AMP phosphodiesterase PgpH